MHRDTPAKSVTAAVAVNHAHGTPTNTYVRGPSVDNQSNVLDHVDSIDSAVLDTHAAVAANAETDANAVREHEEELLLQREEMVLVPALVPPPQRSLPLSINSQSSSGKQRRFAQQRSILKNSQERSFMEENEVLEAKKQLILRRRRLFSHYRQYDQWRRRQFSYDPSYFRPPPLPSRPLAYADYGAPGIATAGGHEMGMERYGNGYGNGNNSSANANAGRRRRQYRRQYSCADRSRDGSRESRGSSSLQMQLQKYHSMVASDTIHTESSVLNHSNYSEPASVSGQFEVESESETE